ncbi:MAG: hypothetical protein J6R77_01540, partial [Clostridia bacterium]|nr:hypothetical protein [Clostridia bacterium]
ATGAVYCEAPAGGNGSSYAGGLAGYIQNGTVENNYAGNPSVQCLYTNVVKDAESYAGRLFGGFVVFGGGNNYVNGAMTIKRSRYVAAVTGCNGTPESMGTLTEPSEQPENGTFTYGSQNPRQVVGWGVYGASATFSPWVDDGNNPVLYMERRVGYRVTYMLDGNVINLTYKEGMPKEEVNIVTPQMVGYEPDLHGVGFSTNGGQKTITYTHVHVAEGEATCLQPQRCTICLVEMSGLGAHQFEAGASDPVPPTCEENGYTLYTCILCAEEVKRDFVPPTGHLLDDHCTCTLCGEQFPAPLRDYAVFVFDSETTHPIAEARVQIGDLAVYTDAQGAARFQLAPDTAAPLSIEKDGYPDYENASFVLGQMPYTYVYLQSTESGIYEAWCNGDNVLLMDSQINNLSPALTAHVVVAGRAQAPITKYELVQDGQVIATSTTGAFLVKNPHFKQNVPVYARMHTEGQEGHNLFEQQLNIAVVGFSFTAELDDLFPFVTGLNIDFTDGSPLLSGVSLKLPGFRENDTIHVSAGNNKVVISYGVEKDYFDKDVDTKNAAEIMKKLRDKFVQQNNPHFWPKGKAKSEVTAAGAFVLEIGKDSSITAAYGEIHVGYELSYKWGKTFAVWVVPVYVGFKAGLQGELTITDLGYDIENSKFLIPDADFTLQAEIAAYGGLGCSLLSAGVYGAVGGEITVGAKDLQEYFRYMLYGEMGVYVRVDLFFWKEIEYRLPLLHGSIFGPNGQIKSRRAMLSMANYQTGLRQYLENRSDWLATALLAAAGGEAHSLLQSSSYSAIQPRIVTCGDTRMMLFLDDDGSEGFNYQHLYYSLFDTATNTWGTPQRVDDSPFADLEYDVYADENGIYLAYTKAGDITAENEENYAAVLSQVEVYTAHYDAETGRFAGHTNLSCNDSYDSQPQVTGEAVLWVNNLTGDVLSENANNTLVLSEKTATGWGAPRPLGDRGATVTSLDMGMLSGETCIALIRDTDCDLPTETDRQVALMTTSGEVYAVPTAAGTNAGVRFATAGGQEAVQWYGEGNIWQLTEPDGAPTALLAEPLPGLTDEFCHLQLDEETEVLLFAQNGMADGVAGSRLYAIYHTGEGWGQPVPLTDSIPEQYIDAFDACVYNGDLLLSYLVTEATFTDTDFTRTSYFMSSRIPTKYDLAVGEAVCLESELFSGPTIDWHLPVTNLSRDPLKQVTVQVQTAAGAPVYDQTLTPEAPIGSGDTGYVTLTLPKD